MSYDFHLFLPKPGVYPLVTAQTEFDDDDEGGEINPGPPDPGKESRKRAIAAALTKEDPALEVFQFRFEEISKSENITIEEAKVRYRHMELNGPDDGPGIQITLVDDRASLTVPYWHTGEKANAVFAQIWKYLAVIQNVAGYQIYDPQTECIINLSSDRERVTNFYANVATGVTTAMKRPWWKFW